MASVDGSKSVFASSDDGSTFYCTACDYGGVKKEAKFYCPQCQDYLCDSCKSVHQNISATRSHKVVSGSIMPKKPERKTTESTKRYIKCPCSEKDITIYCHDHYEVMCVDCRTFKHRNCNTVTIEEASADLDKTDTDASKERMKTLKDKLEKVQQKENEDAEMLTVQAAKCRVNVEEFKRELIQKIEELTKTALDDIEKSDGKQRVNIDQHINTCRTALNRMEIDYNSFEEAVTEGMNSMIFIHNLKLKKTFEQIDKILQDIENDVKAPGISFEFDETLKMTNVQSLGVVRSTSTIPKESRPVIADMKIESIEKVDVKFSADQYTPEITGSLFLPNGELILCDNYNRSVKVLNADFTQKEQLKLESRPCDLCLMENDEIVITQPGVKQLLFMKVVPKLQIGSSTSLDQICYGVAVHNGLVYVSFSNGEIRILDRTSQQQRNVYSGFSFKCPYYISVMPTGMMYVSESDGNNIRVLKDGKEISNYSSAAVGISIPMGIYIDGAENILVCEYLSDNLRLIDAKGNTSKVILSETDGLCYPRTVSVRPNDNTIIVGGITETLVVCKLTASPK